MAAILETGHHGWHRYNFTCLNIWICSRCINLYVYQFWCFYHKVNGWFSMPDYAAALLCLIEGNPPLAHDKACSTENLLPQVHIDGISDDVQPYLRARASWKAPLWRVKPCSTKGRAVNQVDAPFSFARSTDLCSEVGRSLYISSASAEVFTLLWTIRVLTSYVVLRMRGTQ